jgi:hypothetical protein
MTAQWALELIGERTEKPVQTVAKQVVQRFAEGASTPDEVRGLASLERAVIAGQPMGALEATIRALIHSGFLRGVLVTLASTLEQIPRADVALVLARELMDAVDPELGIELARAALALTELESTRMDPHGAFVVANRMLGETMLERGAPQEALRHFEAVLAVDVQDARALRGWSNAILTLERRGVAVQHRSRGLALLDGLDDLEFAHGFGSDRYEVGRPRGGGRPAVVYEAYDRNVHREVALKRLLDPQSLQGGVSPRVLQSRFFAEARTLAGVRSPFVVSLLDVQARHRFIALELCRGGNLRLALRRGLVGPDDLPRVGHQLQAALEAVHVAGAVHRDIKPSNILVRSPHSRSTIALADFGVAVGTSVLHKGGRAGTLRYLAPELRTERGQPSAATDRFSAGVVLLELAIAPAQLPASFDRLDGNLDAQSSIPETVPEPWGDVLRRLLATDPAERHW